MEHLKSIIWFEIAFAALASVAAAVGQWGLFAALAFMSVLPVLWLIAIGIWAIALGEDTLDELLQAGQVREPMDKSP